MCGQRKFHFILVSLVFAAAAVLVVDSNEVGPTSSSNETLVVPDPTVVHCLDQSNCTSNNDTRYDHESVPADGTGGARMANNPQPTKLDEPTFWCPENYHPTKRMELWFHMCRPRSCARVTPEEEGALKLLGAKSYSTSGSLSPSKPVTNLVCRQFTSNFTACPKMLLTGAQFRLLEGGRVTDAASTFVADIGDYYWYGDELVVCDPSNGTQDGTVVADTPASCFPIRLDKTRFTVMANRSAKVDGVNSVLPRNHYAPAGDGVTVDACFTMSSNFSKCSKTSLEAQYIHLQSKDLSLFTDDTVEVIYPLGTFIMSQDNSSALVCVDAGSPRTRESLITYAVLALISTLFLLLSLLAHLWIPNLNFHTKALLCLLFAMMCMYLALAIRNFIFTSISWISKTVLFSMQYTFGLSSFFWLNVLAFDLWYVFANQNGIMTPGSVRGKKRRFFIKCGYAWGIPVLLCAVVLIINGNKDAKALLGLELSIGDAGWFSNTRTIFIFFYMPIVIILVENIIFFVLTIVNIRKASKGTDILNKKVSRQLLVVFAKLFIVMGICWFFEIISFALAHKTGESAWYFTDSINLLQGVFIFFVYVFKRTTIKIIRAKLGYPVENGSQVTKSTSSSQQENRKTSVASTGNQSKKKAIELTKLGESNQNGGERVDCQTKC